MAQFELVSDYQPRGDQPQAIHELTAGIERGDRHQVLLGVTGSGKTFTMANVINQMQRPTLVLAHNKTLAAQLYGEFKELFPNNAVEYLSAITIITSLKPTFPQPTRLSKKTARSTKRSTNCAIVQPAHCCLAEMS